VLWELLSLPRCWIRRSSKGWSLAKKEIPDGFQPVRKMNEGKSLDTAGTVIRVANVADIKLKPRPIGLVDKTAQIVRVYSDADQLLAAYPATIGSEDTPSPKGEHKVVAVAKNPTYIYDPRSLISKGQSKGEVHHPARS
jgi:hypothetical protein